MNKYFLTPIVFVLPLLAGCGDDDDSSSDPVAGRDFCAVATDIDELFGDLDENSTPDEVRPAIDQISALLDEAEATAPAELADAVSAIATFQRQQVQAVIDAGYDLNAFWAGVDDSDFDQFSDSEAEVDGYLEGTCGLDLSD